MNLRIYFWLNGKDHSWLKVRSSVIRLIKRAFQDHGISMPDEAREVIFPRGIPVTMISESPADAHTETGASAPAAGIERTPERVATAAEGGLSSEADTLEEQARQAQQPDEKEDLLRGSSNPRPTA